MLKDSAIADNLDVLLMIERLDDRLQLEVAHRIKNGYAGKIRHLIKEIQNEIKQNEILNSWMIIRILSRKESNYITVISGKVANKYQINQFIGMAEPSWVRKYPVERISILSRPINIQKPERW